MAVVLAPLNPLEAIAQLDRRGQRQAQSFAWQDLWQEEHANAFTVAKSSGFDILGDIHSALEDALKNGTTFDTFRRDLTPTLQAKGWWGKQPVDDPVTGERVVAQLGSARRLKTIFDVNMRVSYATGHWANFERNKAARPYLRYVCILDEATRPEHRARHNLCLPVDHPYWDVWAPPCGWNCRCTLQSLSKRDVERMRDELIFEPPADLLREWLNKRTGEVTKIPKGIDPGWAYNPGKAGHRAGLSGTQKLIEPPPKLAALVNEEPNWLLRPASREFADWLGKAARGERMDQSVVTVGSLGEDVLNALDARGIAPQTGAITLDEGQVRHMLRDAKADAGKAVPFDMLRLLPALLARPKAVLRDLRDDALLYVFDNTQDPRLGKIVVRLDFADKARRPETGKRETIVTNAIRTAGLVPEEDLTNPSVYEVLKGSL